MQIAIIGTGSVGSALARSFQRAGHRVTIGSRAPDGRAPVAGVTVDTIVDALQGAEAVVLAVPSDAVDGACAALGDLERRVVIDPTNPVASPPPAGYASNAAFIAARLPRAKVVKAFNAFGAEILSDAAFPDGTPVLPIAGDDHGSVESIARLARDCGFEPLVLGGLDAAVLCEAMARTWITVARTGELGRNFAFGLLVR